MTKIKSSKKARVLALAVLLLLVGLIIALERAGVTHFSGLSGKKSPQAGPTEAQKKQEADINAKNKQQFIEQNSRKTNTPQTNTDTATSTKSLELSARSESNDSVTVFTKLYGYSSGSCKLTAINGSKSVSQTAVIIYQPEYSSCAGFSVSKTDLGAGTWTLQLDASSAGTIESKTITFEVS